MSKQIEVEVGLGGTIDATVKGVEGPSCQGDLDWMSKLGIISKEEPTEDFCKNSPQREREAN